MSFIIHQRIRKARISIFEDHADVVQHSENWIRIITLPIKSPHGKDRALIPHIDYLPGGLISFLIFRITRSKS